MRQRRWGAVLLLLGLLLPGLVQAQTVPVNSSLTIQGNLALAAPLMHCDANSGTDSYACTLSPAITAYVNDLCYSFTADVANTGTASINYNTVGPITITKVQGGITTVLEDNDIRVGQVVHVCYDGIQMQMVSQLGNVPLGTGDVTKVGTPVDNQLGVWTGNGTMEGDAALTFDTATNTLAVGAAGNATGHLNLLGTTSGVVTVQTQDAAGTYNFNLPTTAGNSGDVLASAGGVGAPMTWVASNGTGNVVRTTSASLTTPSLGVASATSVNKVTLTAPATGSTLTIAEGKTFTASNTLTLSGTDGASLNVSNAVTAASNYTSGQAVYGAGANKTTASSPGLVLDADGIIEERRKCVTVTTDPAPMTARCYFVDTSGGNVTLTLPNGAMTNGAANIFDIYKVTNDANQLILNADTGDLINFVDQDLTTTDRLTGFHIEEQSGATEGNWIAQRVITSVTASMFTFANTSRLLGRITAGAGAGEELTAANVKTILALASSDLSDTANLAKLNATNAWADGVKQTFNPDATSAGVNVGSQAGDPSTPANGDLWYDSTANELTARINGANVPLGAGGGVSDGDKGDITVSGSGGTWTVDSTFLAATKTLTNTRINPRVVTLTDAATVTPNSDTTDMGILTTLSQDTTFNADSGTPVDGQKLTLRIKSTTARVLTWTAGVSKAYRSGTMPCPASTSGGSLTDYVGLIYNGADARWDCVSFASGY